MLNNKAGYSTIIFLSTLPIILTLILSLCFIFLFSYDLTKHRQSCLTTGLKIQKKILIYENKLLSLNPLIKKFRLERSAKKIQLSAALISGNEVLALKIQQEIYFIEKQLELINIQQK